MQLDLMLLHRPDFYEATAKSSARDYGSLQENNNAQTKSLEYFIDYHETRTGARNCEIQRSYSVIAYIINTEKKYPIPHWMLLLNHLELPTQESVEVYK